MAEREIFLIVFVAEGLLFAVLGMPLIMRRVPPNRFYGFRLPSTVNDEALWYPVNAYAGRWLVGVGLALVIAAAVMYPIREIGLMAYLFALTGTLLVGSALVIGFGVRRLSQLKSGRRDDG